MTIASSLTSFPLAVLSGHRISNAAAPERMILPAFPVTVFIPAFCAAEARSVQASGGSVQPGSTR